MSVPGTLETVSASSLEALGEHIAHVRHDLGKYVAFQLRWLPPVPSDDELREALEADLARTRASDLRVESAPALWSRLREPLVGAAPLADGSRIDMTRDPDLLVIDGAIRAFRALLPQLGTAPRRELEVAMAGALEVAAATRRLQRRVRALRTP